MIPFACPNCGKPVRSEGPAGESIACPACGATVTVPTKADAAPVQAPTRGARSKAAGTGSARRPHPALAALGDVALAIVAVALSAWAYAAGGPSAASVGPYPLSTNGPADADVSLRIDERNHIELDGQQFAGAGRLTAALAARDTQPRTAEVIVAPEALADTVLGVVESLSRAGTSAVRVSTAP